MVVLAVVPRDNCRVALVLLAGCPSEKKEAPDAGPPGPKQLTEKEPNDRPEQAQPIDDSSIVSASQAKLQGDDIGRVTVMPLSGAKVVALKLTSEF